MTTSATTTKETTALRKDLCRKILSLVKKTGVHRQNKPKINLNVGIPDESAGLALLHTVPDSTWDECKETKASKTFTFTGHESLQALIGLPAVMPTWLESFNLL